MSAYQVRDELTGLIERELPGPWDGELEVLPPRSAGPGDTPSGPESSAWRRWSVGALELTAKPESVSCRDQRLRVAGDLSS